MQSHRAKDSRKDSFKILYQPELKSSEDEVSTKKENSLFLSAFSSALEEPNLSNNVSHFS